MDRYKDRVSIEVREAMSWKRQLFERAVAISLAVRYSQSPQSTAAELAKVRSGPGPEPWSSTGEHAPTGKLPSRKLIWEVC